MSTLLYTNNTDSGPSQPRTFTTPPSPQAVYSGTVGDTIPGGRLIYYGIKRGRVPGVYVTSSRAEEQVHDYPDACVRCFSSRFAAQAYIYGWDCQGRYSLPKGSPRPLYEHLLINYSTPPYLLSPPTRARSRAAYIHPRPTLPSIMDEFGSFSATIPSNLGIHPGLASSSDTLTHRASSSTLRPPLAHHRNSWRDSMVKSPSPLRNQVHEPSIPRPTVNGVYSPLVIPEMETIKGVTEGTETIKEKKRGSVFGFPSFSRKQSAPTVLDTPVIESRILPPNPPRQPLRESRSSPNLPRGSYQPPSPSLSARTNRSSGLWGEGSSSPLAGSVNARAGPSSYRSSMGSPSSLQASPIPEFSNTEAPTFSRSAMRKSGIIMPAAAPRSSYSTRRSPSTPSLSPSSSSSSLSTISSSSSSGNSSPISDFAPPRAGFMRGPSGLSLSTSPSSSCESVATVKTASLGGLYSETFTPKVYSSELSAVDTKKPTREKKEKRESVMKGFGKMFGIKKKA